MSNITLHPSFVSTFKIQVLNRDPNIMPSSIFGQNGPVFQLENSEFDGINELSQTQTKVVSISLKNEQKEVDVNINVEQCNYDYKGTFNIIGNKFGFLGTQVCNEILWAQSFTSLKADQSQDINGGFEFNRCLNGTFP